MAKTNPELVELFCAKAAVVGAKVHEAANMDAAIHYLLEVCASKAPCEVLSDEAGTELGPLSENSVPTRLNRIVAAPGVDAKTYKALAAACQGKGFVCLKDGLRKYLAGVDVGLAVADLGVAASGTCMVNSDSEETRLSTMMSEICMLLLKKSNIRPDLASIAADLRAMQNKAQAAYTAFITGPSRTADIERVPAVGVHGPLELHIILLED